MIEASLKDCLDVYIKLVKAIQWIRRGQMSVNRRKLYRSNNGVVAGVCAGFASFFGVDTVVLRFAFIALTIATAGLFSLLYVALWLIFPAEQEVCSTVDVQPDAVMSDNYGSSVHDPHSKRKAAREAAAHMPPQPPNAPDQVVVRCQSSTQAPATFGMMAGILLVVVGFACFVPLFLPALTPLQFWPLVLIAVGIARMVLPGNDGYRMNAFLSGSLLLFAGVVFLMQTLGFVVLHVDVWLHQGWPFLLIAFGLLVLWKATDLNGFAVAALAAIVAFCVIGMLFCADLGPMCHLFHPAPLNKGVSVSRWWCK